MGLVEVAGRRSCCSFVVVGVGWFVVGFPVQRR